MIKNNTFQKAVKTAKKSMVARGKVGAVLFTNSGQIVAAACNACVHGKMDKGIFTVHAEQALIIKAMKIKAMERYGINKLNVLVVRWSPADDTVRNARPCTSCSNLLKFAGFRNIYYSDSNGCITKLT